MHPVVIAWELGDWVYLGRSDHPADRMMGTVHWHRLSLALCSWDYRQWATRYDLPFVRPRNKQTLSLSVWVAQQRRKAFAGESGRLGVAFAVSLDWVGGRRLWFGLGFALDRPRI